MRLLGGPTGWFWYWLLFVIVVTLVDRFQFDEPVADSLTLGVVMATLSVIVGWPGKSGNRRNRV
jgi:hypothetical protein